MPSPVFYAELRLTLAAYAVAALLWPAPASQAQSVAPLTVVTTIKPIHALTAAILGVAGKAELLMDGTASPHTYALKPSQVRQLNAADAVVMVSSELETFMDKVVASLPKRVLVVRLDQTTGLVRLPVRSGGLFEDHDHGDGKGHSHAHGHSHGSKPASTSNGKSARAKTDEPLDTHFWLDPENGKAMLNHLTAALSKLRPEQQARFEANRSAASDRIDALTRELALDLQPLAAKPFIVFHDAYQYFENRFGVRAVGSITLNPEIKPGARRMKELRAKLEQGGAVCIFAEPQFEPKLVATLVEGTRVRRGTLDPIGASIPAGPGAYEGILRGLADDLRACLGAPS